MIFEEHKTKPYMNAKAVLEIKHSEIGNIKYLYKTHSPTLTITKIKIIGIKYHNNNKGTLITDANNIVFSLHYPSGITVRNNLFLNEKNAAFKLKKYLPYITKKNSKTIKELSQKYPEIFI